MMVSAIQTFFIDLFGNMALVADGPPLWYVQRHIFQKCKDIHSSEGPQTVLLSKVCRK